MLYDEFLDCFVDNNIIERMYGSYLYSESFNLQNAEVVYNGNYAVNFSLWYHDVKGYVIRVSMEGLKVRPNSYVYLIRNWIGSLELFNDIINKSDDANCDKIIFCLKIFLNKNGNSFGAIYGLK